MLSSRMITVHACTNSSTKRKFIVMSEDIRSLERDKDVLEKRSVLASYTVKALINASSEGFADNLYESITYVQRNTHYATGEAITEANIEAVAASSVLVQMVRCFNEEQPIVLRATVPRATHIYEVAQEVIDDVGLTFVRSELDLPTMLATARQINRKSVISTFAIEAATETWHNRGTVMIEMESFDDIIKAVADIDYSTEVPDSYYENDGARVEEYSMSDLDVPSTMREMPYYAQFFEVEHGLEWLTSLLSDLKAIHSRIF